MDTSHSWTNQNSIMCGGKRGHWRSRCDCFQKERNMALRLPGKENDCTLHLALRIRNDRGGATVGAMQALSRRKISVLCISNLLNDAFHLGFCLLLFQFRNECFHAYLYPVISNNMPIDNVKPSALGSSHADKLRSCESDAV